MQCIWLLLVLLWITPASAQVDGCIYHQRSPGTVEGVPIFMEMWQRGCTKISIIQYDKGARVRFAYSPCASFNMPIWLSAGAPGVNVGCWYWQHSWGQWQRDSVRLRENEFLIGPDRGGVSGTTMWCGEWTKPSTFPGTPQYTTPSAPQRNTLAKRPTPQQKQSNSVNFQPNYLYILAFGGVLVVILTIAIRAGNAPDLVGLRAEIERLHIKKVESHNWSDEWRAHEVAMAPDGSIDTTKILEEWRTKSSKHTYDVIARKARTAAKHFDEDEEEVGDMLVNENEEDIKRWELIKGEERPPWGIWKIDQKKKRS